ncbi:MAG TPA: hypothetical protein DCW90_03015 [Lachnospiraceae bacterium]|nr:TM1812 family CRISPR-associated protein [uncultured Lachnoclostridium sp.]HAU84501.1 hypothetical protein [Lachnospiraceae bacterium]
MKHYIVVSYLSIFQRELKMLKYKQRVAKEEKDVYGILTNEAGTQAIFDCIKEESDGQEYTVDVFYFRSKATENKTLEKRQRFNDFYNKYNQVIIGDLLFIKNLKKDIPYKNVEKDEKELSESEYYELRVKRFAEMSRIKNVSVDAIPVNENSQIMDANKEQIQELINRLNNLKEKYSAKNEDFSIYIDSTGGPRDFSFLCIMLIKLLQLAKYNINEIVYSNINGKQDKEIISLNSTYAMLDISNGVSDFIKYGRVTSLRESLGRSEKNEENKDAVDELLKAMEQYSNKLAVCDLQDLDVVFDSIDSKMEELEKDDKIVDSRVQIMKLQFDEIRRQMAIQNPNEQFIVLLENYLGNGMLQQAVTLYNERMPYYLMNTLGAITIPNSVVNKKDDESDINYARKKLEKMLHGFSKQSGKKLAAEFIQKDSDLNDTVGFAGGIYVLKHIDEYLNGTVNILGKQENIISILKDYVIIRELRNHLNHVSENEVKCIMNDKSREFFGLEINKKDEDSNKVTTMSLFEIVEKHINIAYNNLLNLSKQEKAD